MAFSACDKRVSISYTAKPITGTIVDKATGEPVAGAHVLVFWPVYIGSHGTHEGNVEIKEAVTDKNGKYHIEGWGPKQSPFRGSIDQDEPSMLIFKPWYYITQLRNYAPGQGSDYPKSAKSPLDFYWNSKKIKIRAVDNWEANESYANSLRFLRDRIYFLYHNAQCDWAKAPNFLLAIEDFRKRLILLSYDPTILSSLTVISPRPKHCPSLSSVFGEIKL